MKIPFLLQTGLEDLVDKTLPPAIRLKKPTNLGPAMTEHDALDRLKEIAKKNKVFRNFIGMGYHGTRTPAVILRNILENPSWYTQVGDFMGLMYIVYSLPT